MTDLLTIMPLDEPQNQDLFDKSLNRLLADYQVDAYILPPLKEDVSQLERWFKLFSKWLHDLISRKVDTSIDLSWLKEIWFYLVVVAAVLLLILLIWQIYKRVSDSELLKPHRLIKTAAGASLEAVTQDMARALQRGDFGLAARLRWLVFLGTGHHPLSTTPVEFLPQDPEIFKNTYPLMFSEFKSQDAFDKFDHKLKKLTEKNA